jgi:hypothetical protein
MNKILSYLALCFTLIFSQFVFAATMGQPDNSSVGKDEVNAADVLKLEPESMAQRQLQTRKYSTTAEEKIRNACISVLQDSGFTVENTDAKLGTILASKQREAVESGQVAGALIIAVIFGVAIPIDKNQSMFASIVVSPAASEKNASLVRITFSRLVWNDRGAVSKAERLEDPEVYQTFFTKLSKGLFLEAQSI